MTITDDAKKILRETLEKHNKNVLTFCYDEKRKQVDMGIGYDENYIGSDGFKIVYDKDAELITSGWTIVEFNGKLQINKSDCDCCSEYKVNYSCKGCPRN